MVKCVNFTFNSLELDSSMAKNILFSEQQFTPDDKSQRLRDRLNGNLPLRVKLAMGTQTPDDLVDVDDRNWVPRVRWRRTHLCDDSENATEKWNPEVKEERKVEARRLREKGVFDNAQEERGS